MILLERVTNYIRPLGTGTVLYGGIKLYTNAMEATIFIDYTMSCYDQKNDFADALAFYLPFVMAIAH
jgi:hypothetical protein